VLFFVLRVCPDVFFLLWSHNNSIATHKPESKMNYNTYQITIAGVNNMPKILTFEAVDHQAALADVKAAYGDDVEVWSLWLL
jgi:hypothetical protein